MQKFYHFGKNFNKIKKQNNLILTQKCYFRAQILIDLS